jgi:5-methyltetrahydropteroyltriglutamate--homocysteine methyltransferase
MALSTVHGFPRIGPNRELKFALEGYWRGERTADELQDTARGIRRANWELMRDAGIDLIPSNDFSLYDQMLDTAALVGAVPRGLDAYFAAARGTADTPALEMTKWFDTNYHYIVPELGPDTRFGLGSTKPFDEYAEAKALGIETKPVLVGPLTFLLLSKSAEPGFDVLSLLDPLVDVYAEALGRLDAEWVQLDEPAFVEDRTDRERELLARAYERLAASQTPPTRPKIVVSTYFGRADEAVAKLPVEGIGLDLLRGGEPLDVGDRTRFAGVVDGRNVWINDLRRSAELLPEGAVVSTSCSLQHVPISLEPETGLDPELRSWMAFATEKLHELAALARGDELDRNREALESRRTSKRTRNPEVRERVAALTEDDASRDNDYEVRRDAQSERLALPLFPTTTIGSFPQTSDVRAARAALRKGEIDEAEYERLMRAEIERVIRLQEELGLDVLVHGEPERNDMVQYFGERMDGYAFTENGWVQSYGSRYVRPPILFGDVSRPHPITVEWTSYAQSLTDKPVKGMLTGPVTMLKWSFVRDDQPEAETAEQLALATRDEVLDLEAAGIPMIQVDEPAIREGLPLRRADWDDYLGWAVHSFRVATGGVRDDTQVHTHMCYSEFGDIIDSIAALDADVASVEAARSRMELMEDLRRVGYRQQVGPGVYDIHSPRVPSADEMAGLLRRAADVLEPGQLWVNPDCGLKTRTYEEAEPSLRNMVRAAGQLREELAPARR